MYIKINEICLAIQGLKRGKSAGTDGVINEIVINVQKWTWIIDPFATQSFK